MGRLAIEISRYGCDKGYDNLQWFSTYDGNEEDNHIKIDMPKSK